jgi:tRNA dimethylallyltransferase
VYDAGRFIIDADRYVNEIAGRGKTPILVGGTGLYLRAWRYGLSDVPARNEEVRAQLEEEKQRVGPLGLYERLKSVDWDAAQKIAPTDDMRVTRALEIFMLTGERPSELRQSHMRRDPRFVATWILLNPEREWLNQRIAERVTKMFDAGLVEEAVRLKTSNMMGHEEALLFAQGVMTKSEAIERTQIRHRQYAKRQMTWFKKEPWWTSVDLPSEDPIQLAMNIIGTLPTQR